MKEDYLYFVLSMGEGPSLQVQLIDTDKIKEVLPSSRSAVVPHHATCTYPSSNFPLH